MVANRFAEGQVAVLSPVVDRLLTMIGAARDAFNRHSRNSLEELKSLQGIVAQTFHDTAGGLKALIGRKLEEEQLVLIRVHNILDRLMVIGDNLGGCADPIEQKIRGGVLFSEKAVTQANFLFDQHAGIIRSVWDIFKTDNDFLKKYVLEEARKLGQACLAFATEHEERMIEGLCLPQAAPIFLALLDRMGTIAQQEVDIATLLAREP
jgi:Na+/phosphate symporter